ncbi:MAG: hypothetical protein DWG80_00205 [Chloroflexi bacterium]|nr:hypothetical protein [Chloroflexota bacterium]
MVAFKGVPTGARRLCLFGDEAGDLTFSRGPSITRYFYLTTVAFADHGAVQADLQELRHDIAAGGFDRQKGLHATSDPQWIRNRVFDVLSGHDFAVDTTIFDKPKANPRQRPDPATFYRFAWIWHLQRVIPDRCLPTPELLVVAAEISLNAKRQAYHQALKAAMQQVSPQTVFEAASWPAATDLCTQAADYCGWAVLRKWESGDTRSYARIAKKIGREYDLFQRGTTEFY